VGLVIYLLYALTIPTDKSESERIRVPTSFWMVAMAGLSLVCYAGVLALLIAGKGAAPEPPPPPPGDPVIVEPPTFHTEMRPVLLMFAGLFALLGICQPFARDLMKLRWRRIWALSKIGFKEAVRSRLLWVFLIVLLPFLVPVNWFIPIKPSDELRTMVAVTSIVLMILVLFPAVLLASFSIPNDIKNQTIHTVVTKPVERFEIVLGRFFGYTFLMSLVLAGLTLVSLVLINATKIDEKAEEETAKARIPIRGRLEFKSRKAEFEGTNVGREFDYRRYIAGHEKSPQRAIWHYAEVPSAMTSAPDDRIPVEFTFDVFRMTKGEENRGVIVNFRFVTHNCPQLPPLDDSGIWRWGPRQGETPADAELRRQQYEAEAATGVNPKGAKPGTAEWEKANRLAEKYGIFEIPSKEVYDYQVGGVEIPAGLFRNAQQGDPGTETGKDGKPRQRARLSIYVKCESGGQLLGMAEPDLYLLEGNLPFSLNFVKGAVGLWCRLCIVIGLAVACSTYLSGVLSLLCTLTIFLIGYFTDHLNDLAYGRNIGGGPAESAFRLVRTEQPTAQLPTSGTGVLQLFDKGWAWVVRRIQNVIPDVESFTWTNFVSEGFNINAEYLILNLLVTVGYLLPWAILAYYLMKSREIAN
ncbi:MAG TPA: ABC transporter permease, partial [Gemmataceae bacterium]|nr:ABC transporter permease [Gemmataceae bacterium]